MKNNKLSHSAVSKFQECPTAYKFHYIDKLRSKTQSAALLFGSAVDQALTTLVKPSDKTAEEVFTHYWTFQQVNKKDTFLATCTEIVYAESDYDKDLLTQEDINKLKDKYSLQDPVEEVNKIYKEKEYEGFTGLPEDRKLILNHANWLSLHRKGIIMIETVRKEILPNIIEVLGTQEYTSLKNQNGDEVVAYADLICRYKGYDVPIVLDWKTSSIEYKESSVLTSPQLTLYVHSLYEKFKTRKAGFIVINKRINKNKTKFCSKCNKDGTGQRHKTCDAEVDTVRCNGKWDEKINPKAFIQVIIDDIPERTEEVVLENYDFINESIKNGVYHRNFASCEKPWGKCVFYNKCFKNTDEGLIKNE